MQGNFSKSEILGKLKESVDAGTAGKPFKKLDGDDLRRSADCSVGLLRPRSTTPKRATGLRRRSRRSGNLCIVSVRSPVRCGGFSVGKLVASAAVGEAID